MAKFRRTKLRLSNIHVDGAFTFYILLYTVICKVPLSIIYGCGCKMFRRCTSRSA